MQLEFSAMALEYNNDFVQVFDSDGSTLLGKFSGFSPPPKLVSSGTTMRLALSTDDVVWQDQGFTASFTSVDIPDLTPCEPGKFGPFCDSDVCFGSLALEDDGGIIHSGINFPGGVECDWMIGKDASSSYESTIFSFNEVDMEPNQGLEGNVPDQIVFKDGDSDDVLYTVRGRSSECSRDNDCNPNRDSESPSSCVFADEADIFGVCECEVGFVNSDCSESTVTLTPTKGFVTVTYETDINDPSVFDGWNMTYSLCGGRGFGPCAQATHGNEIISESVVPLETILSIVAAAIFVIAVVVIYFRRHEHELEVEIQKDHMELKTMRLENEKLHENLKMLQQYSKEEIDMIEGQIVTFRANFR